jgi:hypothetical protein
MQRGQGAQHQHLDRFDRHAGAHHDDLLRQHAQSGAGHHQRTGLQTAFATIAKQVASLRISQ